MHTKQIGHMFMQARKNKNLSQTELADKLYVTQQTISAWEQGKTNIAASYWKSILRYLDLNIAELYVGIPIPTSQEEEFDLGKWREILF